MKLKIKMCKFNPKNDSRRIDPCMEEFIFRLKQYGIKTLSCCCGHKKYSMTIVVEDNSGIFDIVSGIEIPGKKKFYKKDKNGYYYIPEVILDDEANRCVCCYAKLPKNHSPMQARCNKCDKEDV